MNSYDFSLLTHQRTQEKGKVFPTIAELNEEVDKEPEGPKKNLAKKALEAEEKAWQKDTCGCIYVKTDWKGNGPSMPPMKSEHLLMRTKSDKNRNVHSGDKQNNFIDFNDPRNENIIK